MFVAGDEMQLKRVLINLVENAIRYTESGGAVTVSAERIESLIEWRVRDTGCGISHEHLNFVFDRFYRADKTRSRNSGGSGLGLAICMQIVQAHGGRITVESELGVGSSFVVLLPASQLAGGYSINS